jgi:hypothetical protein
MKRLIPLLCSLVLIVGFGGTALATQYTFNFNSLPANSNSAAIGTYMTGIYGSTVTVTGQAGPVSEMSGLFTTGYIESESGFFTGLGQHAIQITFAVPITSVTFDWATYSDPFNADYSIKGTSGFTNFFHANEVLLGNNSGINQSYTFASPVKGLLFHDSFIGEVGIDNLRVTTPEPMTMLLFGLGLVGLAGVRRYRK